MGEISDDSPNPESDFLVVDDSAPDTIEFDGPAAPKELILDANRVRQLSMLRKSLYRTRTHSIVAMTVAIVGVIELARTAVPRLQQKQFTAPTLAMAFAAAFLLLVAGYFSTRIILINRELKQSHPPEPTTPPDFSQF